MTIVLPRPLRSHAHIINHKEKCLVTVQGMQGGCRGGILSTLGLRRPELLPQAQPPRQPVGLPSPSCPVARCARHRVGCSSQLDGQDRHTGRQHRGVVVLNPRVCCLMVRQKGVTAHAGPDDAKSVVERNRCAIL